MVLTIWDSLAVHLNDILNGDYRSVKTIVRHRSDLEGGLANGKHIFREKTIFGRIRGEEIKRFSFYDFR